MKLPLKLGKAPLIEAVFELRFTSSIPASNVLPGVIFGNLPGEKSITRLPAADLPQQLRNVDPNLAYAALVKIGWNAFSILVSDRSIALARTPPYPGWNSFKAAVLQTLEAVGKSQMIENVERISVKYTNVFPKEFGDLASVVKLNLQIGELSVVGNNILIRAEIPKNDMVHVVQLASEATTMFADGTSRKGPLLEIDTIAVVDKMKYSDFLKIVTDRVELIHDETKVMFFTCVGPQTVEKMEPIYD